MSFDHLEEIFGVYGKILKVQRDIDGPPRCNLGVHKLHCFIDFESLEVAEKVIECMDGGVIDNNTIEVQIQRSLKWMKNKKKSEKMPKCQFFYFGTFLALFLALYFGPFFKKCLIFNFP